MAEAVGQFNYDDNKNFNAKYRRADDVTLQEQQALRHAQAHSSAANYSRCAGVVAWCAFDYASLMNFDEAVKCPGIADVFRIPKLGASFYLAQCSPQKQVVIEPNFYWASILSDASGSDARVAIFSNCDRLELFFDGKNYAALHPDRAGFPHISYPPFFVELPRNNAQRPELRIDGYVGERLALSRMFSGDRSAGRLHLRAEDAELIADGADATWLVIGAVDKFGAPRSHVGGQITLKIEGQGQIIGDNPFDLAPGDGWGTVLVRSVAGGTGRIRIAASHPQLGHAEVDIVARDAK